MRLSWLYLLLSYVLLSGCLVPKGTGLIAQNAEKKISQIAKQMADPDAQLKTSLVVLGNSSLDEANIVFLPEIHDDPDSLLTQLMLIAREKKKAEPFIILDESLGSMEKSKWDVFSQKTLEVVTATNQLHEKRIYTRNGFENELKNLANLLNKNQGLTFLSAPGIWAILDFSEQAMPFYGWDLEGANGSLLSRNVEMVASLKTALESNDRILVMLGARHVPGLEFMTSKKLICEGDYFNDIDQYFAAIEKKFGSSSTTAYGIGTTAPIHKFLAGQRYAIAFDKSLYSKLDQVVGQFSRELHGCLSLKP